MACYAYACACACTCACGNVCGNACACENACACCPTYQCQCQRQCTRLYAKIMVKIKITLFRGRNFESAKLRRGRKALEPCIGTLPCAAPSTLLGTNKLLGNLFRNSGIARISRSILFPCYFLARISRLIPSLLFSSTCGTIFCKKRRVGAQVHYKRDSKLIRQFLEAFYAYVRFGFARTDEAKEKQAQLKLRVDSARAKLESNGIDMDQVHDWQVRNGF